MNIGDWWNDSDRAKLQYLEVNLSNWSFVLHKSSRDRPGWSLASRVRGWYLTVSAVAQSCAWYYFMFNTSTERTGMLNNIFTQNRNTQCKIQSTLEHSLFTYLGCSISYQFSNDVESKLVKFLQLIGTIKRTIFWKVRMETILKIYNTSFTYIFIWVRKLDSNSLTKTKN